MFSLMVGFLIATIALVAANIASASPTFTQCPAIGGDTGCAILITINPNGSISTAADATQGPYDGVEDTLIGVLNSSGHAVGSVTLSASVPLFGFDGDGICAFPFVGNGYCSGLPGTASGYEGPKNTFANINAGKSKGDVVFTGGLADGASTYFSLEEPPSALTGGGGIGGGVTGVPEPSSSALIGLGLTLLGWIARRRISYALVAR